MLVWEGFSGFGATRFDPVRDWIRLGFCHRICYFHLEFIVSTLLQLYMPGNCCISKGSYWSRSGTSKYSRGCSVLFFLGNFEFEF